METKPKTTIGPLPYQPVLPGEVIPEQNIATEQALENMMAALERRKQKPFFDPTLLSVAAVFLTPTKTGGVLRESGLCRGKISRWNGCRS